MAHNIETRNGKASIVYAGETPWHKLGQKLTDAFSAQVALEQGGLDFTVEKVGLQTVDGQAVPNRFAIRRTDTRAVLGVCAGMYQPCQNRDAFRFFDGVFGKDKARYETAGVLGNGEKVWLLARLPGEFTVGKSDLIGKWLLLTNGHEAGQEPIRAKFTPIRVVCQNTLGLALSGNVQSEVRVQHIGKVADKLEFAGKLLAQAGLYFQEVGQVFNGFLKYQVKAAAVRSYTTTVIAGNKPDEEISTIARKAIDRIVELNETGAGSEIKGVRGTLWGAYNAVTEYIDHDKTETDLRYMSVGRGADIKQRAFEVAQDLILAAN